MVREEIVASHRAADRQPGRPQAARRAEIDDARRAAASGVRAAVSDRRRRRRRGRAARAPRAAAGAVESPTSCAAIVDAVRDGRRRRAARARASASTAPSGPTLRVPTPTSSTAALDALDPDVRAALEVADREHRARSPRPGSTPSARRSSCPQGQTVAAARACRCAAPAIYAPGGRAPYPSTVVMGAVTARAAASTRSSCRRRGRRRTR